METDLVSKARQIINVRPKAGLNKAILDNSGHLLETFTTYAKVHIDE